MPSVTASTLERPDTSATDAVRDATKAKIDAIATAQRAGIVSDRLGPSELLAVVIQLSLTGGDVLPILGVPSPPDVRRTSVGTAVAALTEPTVRR